MAYKSTVLRSSFTVPTIISIHYFEYMSNFTFPGESHNFWELVCVDKGVIDVIADQRQIPMRRGNLLFHKPGEYHNILTNGIIAPNLVVIGFECRSPALMSLAGQLLTVQENEKALLAKIIIEARNSFEGRLDDPYQEELHRLPASRSFGSEQLIGNYMEELLIHLCRRYSSGTSRLLLPTQAPTADGGELYTRTIRYMEDHLSDHLTIDTICHDVLAGRSQLQKLFRQIHGCGVIQYFSSMKISAAKQLIRNNHLNFTEISDRLGYTSIHYFSRQFKKITGMTPSEYAASIQRLSEKDRPLS